MEDVLAIILIFGGGSAVAISFSPIGRAIADRIRGRRADEGPTEDVLELRDSVVALQQQLGELAERQDFAERLLAQVKERGLLGAPKGGA